MSGESATQPHDGDSPVEGQVFRASADTSSRNPHDWGRAAAQLFQELAEQASSAGVGPVEENMMDADVRMHVKSIPSGVTISATWEAVPSAEQ